MTRAVTLAEIADGAVLTVDSSNSRLGIGTTNPQALLQVGTGVSVYGNSGIVSATTYYGSGAELTGITAGATLSAGSGDQRVVVTSLTSGTMTSAATDAELTYNSGTNTLSATTFSGALSGNATSATTATTATNAQGLTGTPNVIVSSVTGTTGTFSGNVSIGGILTYEDVTNIDSVGIVTARTGVRVNAGGINVVSGVSTFKGANFNGGLLLREKINITAGKLSDNLNINLNNGMVHHFTTQETATAIPNIMSTVGINTQMDTGDAIAVTIITTAAAAGYSTCITIDNAYNDVKWSGGADPSTGGSSGNDVYALQIIKTGSAAYTVLGALNNFA
jgi:hypothetical protein